MRLIDADVMRERIVVKVQGAESLVLKHELQKWVDEQPTVCGWISVKDRLPEIGRLALVFDGAQMIVARHVRNGMWITPGMSRTVTHWMPLPEPPKEDNNG